MKHRQEVVRDDRGRYPVHIHFGGFNQPQTSFLAKRVPSGFVFCWSVERKAHAEDWEADEAGRFAATKTGVEAVS